ncbi:hypothetical protein DBY68_016865 [Pseudocitrobacter sp. RIT415]|nr:hypothetical protein DBY68_016865 [Pseudocitrobacter sp. RIT 415]
MEYYGAIGADGVSPYLKAYITSAEYCVIGYIGQGASMQIASAWTSPFEGDNAGSIAGIETLSNMAQSVTTTTSVSRWNSLMVWQGSQPPALTLPLELLAISNAAVEVDGAITRLCQMISPELNDTTPGGRRPNSVTVNIGRRFILADVVIQDVSYNLDAPKTSDGYFISNVVNLQLSGMAVQNRSEIEKLFI